jgi:superfamily I DNA and/or RNA helicase
MDGKSVSDHPLIYVEVPDNISNKKNTAPREAEAIIDYVENNRNERIGIITPFVKQKEMIQKELELRNIHNVECGTVHAFQGD